MNANAPAVQSNAAGPVNLDVRIVDDKDADRLTVLINGAEFQLTGPLAQSVREARALYEGEPAIASSAFWRGFLTAMKVAILATKKEGANGKSKT